MDERDDYRFLQINDAVKCINQKVNLVGLVIESGFPKTTRGTDCFCTLKIVDQSYPKSGISVNIFAETMELLPHVASGGDIIQLSLVLMKTHSGEPYALYNKKFSSFALYKGGDGEDFVPYQTSPKFHSRDQDKKFIEGLRKWSVNFQLDKGLDELSSVRELKKGEHIDLVCKLLHICETASKHWMAYVWDGTDTPPTNIVKKLEDEMGDPLPLQLEPLPLSRDLLCTFPTVGSVLRVTVDPTIAKHGLHMLSAGKWVILLNIVCEVHESLWHVVLTPFTKVRHIPDGDSIVLLRQRKYNERLSEKYGRMPVWSFPWTSCVTEVDYKEEPLTTLMDVLTYSEVTAKFKCALRVVAIFPWRAEDFCTPSGKYRVRLTLEDPTARIHAFVYAEDGEKFFDGFPSIDVLRRKCNQLLGVAVNGDGEEVKDAPRNPPWVQLCLKSYYINKSDVWGSRHYRIFGTKLVG